MRCRARRGGFRPAPRAAPSFPTRPGPRGAAGAARRIRPSRRG